MRSCGRSHVLQLLAVPRGQTCGTRVQKSHGQHGTADPHQGPAGADDDRFVCPRISSVRQVNDDDDDGAERRADEERRVEHVVTLQGEGVDEFDAANAFVLNDLEIEMYIKLKFPKSCDNVMETFIY